MSTPTISIVTPSYNQVAFLHEAVESVARQSHPALEHLVIDGASDDGTVEYLQGRDDVDWVSEPDDGQSDALNKGFLRAKGDVIGWLNADDLYLPGAFELVAEYLADHPEVDVVYGDMRWIDEHGDPIEERPSLDFDLFTLRYLHWLAIPSTSTFFRSRIVLEGHVIDPAYDYAMDYEFFLRLANAGYRFAHLPETLAEFRLQPDSKTGVAGHRQLEEHRQAAIDHNSRLAVLPEGLRAPAWQALSLVARSKRIATRARAGHYRRALRHSRRPEYLGAAVPWDRGR